MATPWASVSTGGVSSAPVNCVTKLRLWSVGLVLGPLLPGAAAAVPAMVNKEMSTSAKKRIFRMISSWVGMDRPSRDCAYTSASWKHRPCKHAGLADTTRPLEDLGNAVSILVGYSRLAFMRPEDR